MSVEIAATKCWFSMVFQSYVRFRESLVCFLLRQFRFSMLFSRNWEVLGFFLGRDLSDKKGRDCEIL